MQKLKILNTREVKEIKEFLKEEFGFLGGLEHAFLLNDKGRLFIVNKDISRVELEKLRVDRYGLYFGEWKKGELRLSMEGGWMIGRKGKKNLVELSAEEVKRYFLGEELEKELGLKGRYVLLKYKKDVLGCARYKEGRILNFLPKIHRTGELMV